MPIENSTSTVKSVVFSTTIPRADRYAVTMAAGIPADRRSPSGLMPGATIDTLIGSSMHQSSSSSAKPCQAAPGAKIQADGVVASICGSAVWKGIALPFGSATVGGCQQLKNQPPTVADPKGRAIPC